MRKQIAAYIQQNPHFTTTDISLALNKPPSAIKRELTEMGFYLKRIQRGPYCYDKWVPAPKQGKAA